MGIKVITPAAPVMTIAELRMHLRTNVAGPDDALILGFLAAAQGFAEHYTGRSIGSQTLELALDGFPSGSIALEKGPATAITSIKYIDAAGVEQTLANTDYVLNDYGLTCTVDLAYGKTWPSTRTVANSVKVRYVAGDTIVPPAVLSALALATAHLYENREASTPLNLQELPLGAKSFLDTVREWSF